ncbi:MAG: GNAT family N-acetyltransferase [Rhodobacteraceae bacterium]|nr:GNAT family N-acetyltransferase [Paracoccaceae bacterium]
MADIRLCPLAVSDAEALLQFETVNCDWFERWVGPRPDTYWQLGTLRETIAAQVADDDQMFLIKPTDSDEIYGRLNVTSAKNGVGQLGYRVGQAFVGRRLASRAITLVLPIARKAGLWALEGRVADNNPASHGALIRNGFSHVDPQETTKVTNAAGETLTLTTYRLLLD